MHNKSLASELLDKLTERYIAPKVDTDKIEDILSPNKLNKRIESGVKRSFNSKFRNVLTSIYAKYKGEAYVVKAILKKLNTRFGELEPPVQFEAITDKKWYGKYGIAGGYYDSSGKIVVWIDVVPFMVATMDKYLNPRLMSYLIEIIIHELIHKEQHKDAVDSGREQEFNDRTWLEAPDPEDTDFVHRKQMEFPAHASSVAYRLNRHFKRQEVNKILGSTKALTSFLLTEFEDQPFLIQVATRSTPRELRYFLGLVKRYVTKGTHVKPS